MKKSTFIAGLLVSSLIFSSAGVYAGSHLEKISAYLNKNIRFQINGKAWTSSQHPISYNGTTYLPVRAVAEALNSEIQWNSVTQTISIQSKQPTNSQVEQPKATDKVVTKADLPYTVKANNGMQITINSYSASSGGIVLNITLTNTSTVSDKGMVMTSTYEIYDGKSTLKFIDQDRVFWDTDYMRASQSITGNITFNGLSHETESFILYASLWQYIDAEDVKITFKVE
jgi:hypothetical protein